MRITFTADRIPALLVCSWTLVGAALFATQLSAKDLSGKQLYDQQCASCHGTKGEGTKEYPHELTGDRSLERLTRYVDRRMPKGKPEICAGKDAEKVSKYVFDAFYSAEAQARKQKPRIELARLTARQPQNALADLIGFFRKSDPRGDERGLRGEYYRSRRFRRQERQVERVDPQVSFNFREDSPDPKIKADQFGVRWSGGLLAEETGDHELIVHSENGFRLWLNDNDQPLIDAWVRSGEKIERRRTVKLLAGRAYPLRLEFFKSERGREKRASIRLEWKPPGGVDEIIPTRCLSPKRFPEVFICQAPFPPDDRSFGWERATTISKAWDQATTDAALETAAYVLAHLRDFGVDPGNNDQARVFCERFVERAFRRPLTDEQKRLYVDRQFDRAKDTRSAIQRVVLLTLKSPRFLFREVGDGPKGDNVANRLSFALWDSIPDEELLKASAAGQLCTPEQVRSQCERMLKDPRAHAKVRELFHHWLRLDHGPDPAKDPKRFPGFNKSIAADLRTSLHLQIDEVIWSEKSDFRELFLAEDLYLNGRLAGYYGVKLPEKPSFQKVALHPGKRAGVLTHPYVMSRFAYAGSTSPIHRGVLIAKSLLGAPLKPPPDAFTPLPEKLHPNLTTRERVTLQTKPQTCAACHGMINPLGFPLEQFDAVGRFREKENGKVIDVSGHYETATGKTVRFDGARELAKFLTTSEEAQNAFVEQAFHHLIKQPIRAWGLDQKNRLREAFVRNNFNVQRLIIDIATVAALEQPVLNERKKSPGK